MSNLYVYLMRSRNKDNKDIMDLQLQFLMVSTQENLWESGKIMILH